MAELMLNPTWFILAEAGIPTSIDPDLAIFTAVLFLILLAILWKFAWGPISEGLDRREKGIADQIEKAKADSDRAIETLKQYEAKLATAAEEATTMLAEARKEAESAKERILSQAGEEADRQRQRAISDIEAAKNQAIRELAQASVDSAVALAGRLIGEELSTERHTKLIEESLNKFSASEN